MYMYMYIHTVYRNKIIIWSLCFCCFCSEYPIIIKESEGYTYSIKKKKTPFIKHCNLTLLASSENKSKIIIKRATNQP